RGRLADRILARAVRKRLGHRISAAGNYSHVRQRDVPSRESDAAIRHHDDSGRGDRETHRRRIRRSSAGHRSHASSEHIEIGGTGSRQGEVPDLRFGSLADSLWGTISCPLYPSIADMISIEIDA